ncbi:MAG: glycosyltransferase family 2 protein [Rhabdochlamydiaceae bacterium]|nr:glycosyltransferase family 2 protein [Rhabdochlamydiaceae bacterium]
MESFQPHLTVVSPVYHAESLLDELIERLTQSLGSLTEHYEIILVEDGGKDGSWKKIEQHCLKNPKIQGIQLSRNFGQHAAITAGLEAAQGEWIIVMDCDLQDQPEEIPALYQKAQEGNEIVLASRIQRQDQKHIQYLSKLFYRFLSCLSETSYDSTIANFGIYHRTVINPMLQLQNSLRYFPSMVNWVGFQKTTLAVEHAERPNRKSSYTLRKKFRLAFDILLSYSDKPLRLIVAFGASVSVLAFSLAVYIVYRFLQGKIFVLGYASLAISIAFFSGVIISVLGILGLYIGKIFESSNSKPAFLIRKKING